MTDFITQIDFNILNAIQSIRNPFLDTIMPLITFLGSGGIVWAATALIMLCFKKSRKTGIIIIVSLLLGLFLSTMGLKNVIARERPYNTEGALLTVENLLIGAPSGIQTIALIPMRDAASATPCAWLPAEQAIMPALRCSSFSWLIL